MTSAIIIFNSKYINYILRLMVELSTANLKQNCPKNIVGKRLPKAKGGVLTFVAEEDYKPKFIRETITRSDYY